MHSNSENEISCTPPEIRAAAQAASLELLPEKSRKNYKIVYNSFVDWRLKNGTNSFSEDTLLVYFKELTKKYKSSTLWSHYSMLKSTLNLKHSVNIGSYPRVRALLKRQSEGYQPKKSQAFTGDDIHKFITEAPDVKYLATKVALIMGVMGALRSNELHKMKREDLQFFDGCINVFVPVTKTKVPRYFTITGDFYNIVKKYAELRPPSYVSSSFFLNFQNGKCTKQIIGINKFGRMGKEIAEFLKLPNSERYTGHCLRRSSATLYADGGANITALKRHGDWKSASVAEGYIADSKTNKLEAANKIMHQINPNFTSISNDDSCPSTSANGDSNFTINSSITNERNDINIETTSNKPATMNCSKCQVTINFINK